MALTCYEKKEETIKAELTTLSPLNKVEMMVEELEGGGGGGRNFSIRTETTS